MMKNLQMLHMARMNNIHIRAFVQNQGTNKNDYVNEEEKLYFDMNFHFDSGLFSFYINLIK